jgi:hypothetical protein
MRNPNVKAMATKAKAFVKPITNTTTSFFSGLSKPEKIAVTAAAITGTVTAIGTRKMINDLFPSQKGESLINKFRSIKSKRSKEGGNSTAAVPNTETEDEDDPRDDVDVDLDGST